MALALFTKPSLFKQPRGQVPLTCIGQDNNYEFPPILIPFGYFESSPQCRTARYADKDTFLFRKTASYDPCVFIGHCYDLINNFPIENLGNESGSDTLDFVRPRLPARKHRRCRGLDGYSLE